MNALIITRHGQSRFSGTSGRIWRLGAHLARKVGTSVTTVVVDPDISVDTTPETAVQTGGSALPIWRKAKATTSLVRQNLPYFSASDVTLPSLMQREALSWENFDTVFIHQASLCHLAIDVPSDIRVICILDEDKSRFASRWLRALHGLKIRRLYRQVLRRSCAVVVLTTEEKEAMIDYAGQTGSSKVAIHPLGIDLSVYSIGDDFDKIPTMYDVGVFGAMTYSRRASPVVKAVEESRARGFQWSWTVCGPITPSWRERLERLGVKCTGPVPDLRPHYLSARVVLVPAMDVPGMKTTLLEALALGRPVVASNASTVGTDLVDGEHVLVASTIPQAVEQVESLLEYPDMARDLAVAGSEYVRNKHDLERTSDLLAQDCLRALLGST